VAGPRRNETIDIQHQTPKYTIGCAHTTSTPQKENHA
jgi:hypothetical protein